MNYEQYYKRVRKDLNAIGYSHVEINWIETCMIWCAWFAEFSPNRVVRDIRGIFEENNL